MQQKLRRLEMTKNKLDMELNSLKPEIKRIQAEKANKLRCVCVCVCVCVYTCAYMHT